MKERINTNRSKMQGVTVKGTEITVGQQELIKIAPDEFFSFESPSLCAIGMDFSRQHQNHAIEHAQKLKEIIIRERGDISLYEYSRLLKEGYSDYEANKYIQKMKMKKKSVGYISHVPSNKKEFFYDYVGHISMSIIMAYNSIEIFSNEMIVSAKTIDFSALPLKHRKDREFKDLLDLQRLPLNEKILKLLPFLYSKKIGRDNISLQNFQKLEETRDLIVHLKISEPVTTKSQKCQKEYFKRILPDKKGIIKIKPYDIAYEVMRLFFDNASPKWFLNLPSI